MWLGYVVVLFECYLRTQSKPVLLLHTYSVTLPCQHIPAIELHQLIHTHTKNVHESSVREEAQSEFAV